MFTACGIMHRGSIVGALYHYRPKQVELIEIINKPLLLHLVGYLYYCQMGFNSVFKGLNKEKGADRHIKFDLTEYYQRISFVLQHF